MSNLNSSHAKKLRTNKRLEDMLAEYPGKPFTAKEIAEYVGVDPSRIKQIERIALKKLERDEQLWGVWKEVNNCLQDKK